VNPGAASAGSEKASRRAELAEKAHRQPEGAERNPQGAVTTKRAETIPQTRAHRICAHEQEVATERTAEQKREPGIECGSGSLGEHVVFF
jgi:hypothetical protein